MTTILITKYLLLTSIIVIYIIYTVSAHKMVKKSMVFSRKVRTFHLSMLWLFPFIWAIALKILIKSAPGSHEVEKKEEDGPFFDVYRNFE